jgi:hypothetical protein
VLDEAGWHTHISVTGRVAELRDDTGLVDIDRIARHYINQPYPDRVRPRTTAVVDIISWHAWGPTPATDDRVAGEPRPRHHRRRARTRTRQRC